jgi:hypothetical protein
MWVNHELIPTSFMYERNGTVDWLWGIQADGEVSLDLLGRNNTLNASLGVRADGAPHLNQWGPVSESALNPTSLAFFDASGNVYYLAP